MRYFLRESAGGGLIEKIAAQKAKLCNRLGTVGSLRETIEKDDLLTAFFT
jgi:hypothetical protein